VLNIQFSCTLPTRSSQPLEMAFHPTQPLLLVAYADRMVCCIVYDLLFDQCVTV